MEIDEHGNRDQTPRHTRWTRPIGLVLFQPLKMAWHDIMLTLDTVMAEHRQKPLTHTWLVLMLGLLICWFFYVPIHEFMHVAGCLIAGGNVTELQLSALYGAHFFQKIFPFVTIGEDYAGRLSGFSTGNSDLVYLNTVFFPFVLTILCGGILLHIARKKASPFIFGCSLVIVTAPFISLTGDFLEIGSILITRALIVVLQQSDPQTITGLLNLRSDDLFRLLRELYQDPSGFAIHSPLQWLAVSSIILLSQFTGLIMAGWTYFLSTIPPRLLKV
ncbi:hypothetical protein JXQ70_12095 [bacterium]|nr:hypothetical protein [bacterium]